MSVIKKQKDQDVYAKIVVIGDSGVGKTSILNSFLEQDFKSNMESTIGTSFLSKSITYKSSCWHFQIWDTAGQERFQSLTNIFYKDSHAAIVVYDITQKKSFESLQRWIDELKNKGPEKLVIVIVGNKIDLIEKEAVTFEEAESYTEKVGALFKLTSAKNKTGIDELFHRIADGLIVYNKDKNEEAKSEKVKLGGASQNPLPMEKKCCKN